jgi:hypothetical protein
LGDSFERRVEIVDRICRLTDAQKSKLRLAGRGDIKRFFDRIEALQRKCQPTDAVHDDDPSDLQICGTGSLLNASAIRPARTLGLFEQGSLFSKTLKTLLTEGQAAAFETSALRLHEAGE